MESVRYRKSVTKSTKGALKPIFQKTHKQIHTRVRDIGPSPIRPIVLPAQFCLPVLHVHVAEKSNIQKIWIQHKPAVEGPLAIIIAYRDFIT